MHKYIIGLFAAAFMFAFIGDARADMVMETPYGVTVSLPGSSWKGGCGADVPAEVKDRTVGCYWSSGGATVAVLISQGTLPLSISSQLSYYSGSYLASAKEDDPKARMVLSDPVKSMVGGTELIHYTMTVFFRYDGVDRAFKREISYAPLLTEWGHVLLFFSLSTHANHPLERYSSPDRLVSLFQSRPTS